MLTVADMGEGGVKDAQESADVLYGRPLFYFIRLKQVNAHIKDVFYIECIYI